MSTVDLSYDNLSSLEKAHLVIPTLMRYRVSPEMNLDAVLLNGLHWSIFEEIQSRKSVSPKELSIHFGLHLDAIFILLQKMIEERVIEVEAISFTEWMSTKAIPRPVRVESTPVVPTSFSNVVSLEIV
jgi:hypothetical protein